VLENNKKLLYYYEHLVDWNTRLSLEGPFLLGTLRQSGAKKVLDCGCGLGKHVIFLRKNGFDADGIDVNPLHVIRAKEIAHDENIPANFFLMDAEDLTSENTDGYDAVIMLGNTLSSFKDKKIKKVFNNYFKILKPGGIFIGQVLNYNSFKKTDRTETRWAEAGRKTVISLKTFHFEPDHVLMILNYLENDGSGWATTLDTAVMYYLDTGKIQSMLKTAGFLDITFFGSFKGDPFNKNLSRDIIFTAKKA